MTLAELILAERDRAWRLALAISGDPETAADAVQEACASILASRGAVPSESPRAWFLKAVANTARTIRRKAEIRREREGRWMVEVEKIRESMSPADEAANREAREKAVQALGELDEKFRLPITLCHLEGLSHAEAAAVLEMPKGTVDVYVRRGLERLREVLARRGVNIAPAVALGGLAAEALPAAPAALAASIDKLLAGSLVAGKAVVTGGTAAGSLAVGWKLVAGISLAAILGAGGFTGWKRLHPATATPAATERPAAPPATAEAELEAILARPASIRLSNEPVSGTWLPEFVSRHGFDHARPKNLWTWEDRVTVSHKGTVRECLEKLAAASGVRVSFDSGMVRFWRPADPAKFKALASKLASNDEQERCVAVWRLASLDDPEAVGLVLKPAIEDPSAAVRYWAARGIECRQLTSGALPLLPLDPPGLDREKWVRTALASGNPALRLLATGAAGVWRVLPDDGAVLLACLKDESQNSEVRTTAAWALGRCRFAPARGPLVEVLGGNSRGTLPAAAVRAVERLGLGDLPERLLRQLQEKPAGSAAQVNAIRALGELRWMPAEATIRKAAENPLLKLTAEEALRRLEPMRELGVAELEQAAGGKDHWASRVAFQRLEELGTPEAREALFRLAETNTYYSGAALIRLGDERAADLVLRKATEGDDDKRWVAIRLIPHLPAEARGQKTIELLIDALRKPDKSKFHQRRSTAANALGELGNEAAIPALAEACCDKEPFVNSSAIKALSEIGTPAARQEMLKLIAENKAGLKDIKKGLDEPGVLEKFFDTIRDDRARSHNPCFTVPYTPGLADALVRFLESPDRKLQVLAVSCLGEWGLKCPEGVPQAIKLLGELDQPGDVRTVAMALGSFSLLSQADPRTVAAAMRLLAERRDRPGAENICDLLGKSAPSPEIIAALVKMAARGNDHRLRQSAIKGLGEMKTAQAVEPLLGILEEADEGKDKIDRAYHELLRMQAAGALGHIGDRRAVEPLLKLLAQAPKGRKNGAISALARIGDERAVPELLRVLKEGDKSDRSWAAGALRSSPLAARPEVAAALEEYKRLNPVQVPRLDPEPKQEEPEPIPAPPEVF